MTENRIRRRRVRNLRPEVLRAIHHELLTGASAPQVWLALDARMDEGKLPQGSVPSERTISGIAREIRSQDSAVWAVTDGDHASSGVVLTVLAEVVRRTGGRVTSLTKQQAALVPVVYEAFADWLASVPDTHAWQSYVWTRFYQSWVRTEDDAQDAALFLAFVRSKGKWPAPAWLRAWPRVERVQIAAAGWLPEDLSEANNDDLLEANDER